MHVFYSVHLVRRKVICTILMYNIFKLDTLLPYMVIHQTKTLRTLLPTPKWKEKFTHLWLHFMNIVCYQQHGGLRVIKTLSDNEIRTVLTTMDGKEKERTYSVAKIFRFDLLSALWRYFIGNMSHVIISTLIVSQCKILLLFKLRR